MSDYSTRSKLRGLPGYNVPSSPHRRPVSLRREHFHDPSVPHAIRPQQHIEHDCCSDVIKNAIDDVEISSVTALLARRLLADNKNERRLMPTIASNSVRMSDVESPPIVAKSKKPSLLFTLGQHSENKLRYPRAVAVDAENGDIYVADTGNRRIQRYTRPGVHLGSIVAPLYDPEKYYFQEPTDCAVPAFGSTIVIADRTLGKILIFSKGAVCADHRPVTSFVTATGPPYSVACDINDHVVVATTSGHVEIYDSTTANAAAAASLQQDDGTTAVNDPNEHIDCQLMNSFNVRSTSGSRQQSALFVAVSAGTTETLFVSDPVLSKITCYTYQGSQLFSFQPSYAMWQMKSNNFPISHRKSFVAAGIDVDPAGQIFVIDRLNGALCVFNNRGQITRQLLPVSDGNMLPIQSVAVGPEGHLMCCEYEADTMSTSTRSRQRSHCVKVYKY